MNLNNCESGAKSAIVSGQALTGSPKSIDKLRRPFEEMIQDVTGHFTDLKNAIDRLEESFRPVLSSPTPMCDDGKAEKIQTSDLESFIADVKKVTRDFTARIHNYCERSRV